jgi:hypothetical protein
VVCKRFNLSKPEIEMKGWTANWWISTFGNMNTHTMTTLPTNGAMKYQRTRENDQTDPVSF